MRKIIKKIHLWLSVSVGLIFCIVCLTGAILVFEDEITNQVYSGVSRIERPGSTAMTTDELTEMIAPTLDDDVELRRIKESDSPDKAYKVMLTKPRGAAFYVNQYTGEKMGDCSRLTFFAKTQSLHRWILDPPTDGHSVGKFVENWSMVLSVLIVLTGLILWWPNTWKTLKATLKINFKSKPVFWYSLHVAGGVYAFILLMIMLLTGLTWSFPAYREWVLSVFGELPIWQLHSGSCLGMTGRIIWFIAALLGATLPISGYYLWIRRLKNQ